MWIADIENLRVKKSVFLALKLDNNLDRHIINNFSIIIMYNIYNKEFPMSNLKLPENSIPGSNKNIS